MSPTNCQSLFVIPPSALSLVSLKVQSPVLFWQDLVYFSCEAALKTLK